MQKTDKFLWKLFVAQFVVFLIDSVATLAGYSLQQYPLFKLLLLGIPIIMLFVHSARTLSLKRSLFFIVLTSLIGLIMEAWGLRDGVMFGGRYVYNAALPNILGVPVQIILFWAVFIYTGYCVVNSFLRWSKTGKPKNGRDNYLAVLWLALLDGLVVVAIDLFMDPIQVALGTWTWLGTGPYFNIPTGNFTGWVLVACMATAVYRTFEFFKPNEQHYDDSIHLTPVLGYGLLALSFAATAISLKMYSLTLIGCAIMLPIVAWNLYLYKRQLK